MSLIQREWCGYKFPAAVQQIHPVLILVLFTFDIDFISSHVQALFIIKTTDVIAGLDLIVYFQLPVDIYKNPVLKLLYIHFPNKRKYNLDRVCCCQTKLAITN